MQSNYSSFSKFNNAINYFFGCNPANPYWILLAMYLRKAGTLAIVNDYEGDARNIIAPEADREYWSTLKHNKQWPDDVNTISIIGDLDDELGYLPSVYKAFDEAAKKRIVAAKNEKNIFLHPQWEPSFLLEVTESLLEIDDEWYNTYYEKLFDKTVYRIFAKDHTVTFSPSVEFSEIIKGLIGSNVKRVYNPFAGTGYLANILSNSEIEYIGEETDDISASIAKLRLLSNDVNGYILNHYTQHMITYDADLIVSAPQYSSVIGPARSYPCWPENNSPEEFIMISELNRSSNDHITFTIRKCVLTNTPGIIIAPDIINFKSGVYRNFRKYLVDNDCVDMVISIKPSFFTYTSIPYAIYVINNDHNHKGSIRFVNINNLEIDYCLFLDSLSNNEFKDNNRTKLVTIQEVVDNDYSFAPEAYVTPELDVLDKSLLKRISELGSFNTPKTSHPQLGLLIPSSISAKENKARVFTVNDCEVQSLDEKRVVKIERECVMISPSFRSAVCINPAGNVIYAEYRGQFFFEPNIDIILPQYFALQLTEEYVKQQLGERPIQTAGQSFARSIFRRIMISVPSLEEQQKIVDDYCLKLIGELGMEVSSLKTQRFNEYERNMHLRKHALKQVMNEVLPAARRIANFITSQQGNFSKKSIIAERSQSTLESYVVKLFSNVEKVNSLISALTEETRFNEPQIIEIDTFIANYLRSKLADNYELTYFGHNELLDDVAPDISEEPLIGVTEQGDPVFVLPSPITVYIAPDSLTTVLDNIIANAVKHGFTNPERKDYAIRIEFRNAVIDDRDMVEFIVANNGEKLPAGMSADRMFTWGMGSGTGLGSWQTKNIIEHFGGSIEFIQYEDKADGFNVEYRFTLPMSK